MIKEIFGDFVLLYKNFIHWNISKILIYISAFLFACLLGLPFLVGAFLVLYFSPVDWIEIVQYFSQTSSLPLVLLENLSLYAKYFIISGILMVIGIVLFFAGFMQYLLTTSKLYLSYIDGEPLPFLGNIYFNFKIFWKYLIYLGWLGLILLIPLIIFLIGVVLFVVIYSSISGQIFNVVALTLERDFLIALYVFGPIWIIINFLLFIYMAFRFGYGYLALVDEKNYPEKQSGWFYIKESARLTKGHFWKFLFMVILFFLLVNVSVFIIEFIVEAIGNYIIAFIWIVVAFLCVNLMYEMLFISMYRRVFLKNILIESSQEEKEKGIQEEVV